MNGREYFHESVVKDIIDIITDLKDFDEVQFINNVNNKRSFKSITSATKDLILTFPVMVSTDIEPDNAIMIAKAQEKKMASLLHILFTAISVDCNEDVYDYVRKFHANVGSMGGTLDSYSDAFDKLATTFGESYDATLKIDHAVLETVLEELKESNYTLPDNVNESSLESYKIVPGYRTGYNDMIIKENNQLLNEAKKDVYSPGDLNRMAGYISSFNLDPNSDFDSFNRNVDALPGLTDDVRRGLKNTHGIYLSAKDTSLNTVDWSKAKDGHLGADINFNSRTSFTSSNISDAFEADNLAIMRDAESIMKDIESKYGSYDSIPKNSKYRKDYDAAKSRYDAAKKANEEYRNRKPYETINRKISQGADGKNMSAVDKAKYMESMTKAHNAIVLNNEYKKANELQPTMMVINFMKKDKDDEGYINTAVIGIKCKIYPITSADIVNRISGKLKDKNFLTNFVRATTNEIAFFRDFLFAVDQAKFDAKSYGKNASSNKLWKVLERRSVKSRFRRSLKMYNDATAISTLVMSENDAEYLKKVDNVDILDVAKARKIMDEYNFMCLVVANQSTEVASFLYDTGDDTFEMIPFSGLEREASDNSYKKMVNLLSKVSR